MASVDVTRGAIAMISEGGAEGMKLVLQVSDMRLVNTTQSTMERYWMMLSDGVHTQQAMLATQMNPIAKNGTLQKGSVVQLNEFICNTIQGRRIIIVINLEVLVPKSDIIGVPTTFDNRASASQNRAPMPAQSTSMNQPVELRIAAIQAICAAETENLLSRLRLLRSYLSKEQLETLAITFFQENLPNLSVIRNEKYKVFELQWNDKDGYLPGNQVDGRNMRASLDSVGGLQFSVNSVKKNFLEAANLQIPDFILNEPSENQMPGTRDIFQTPGATSNRLSCGMTPKTLRLPKNGEILMSVHGSPLGVYKEDNLAAIHESGDGSHAHDGAS